MTSHKNTAPIDTFTNDEQQKELRCFLEESRVGFIKLLKRWSCGEDLFKQPSSNDVCQESVTTEKNPNPQATIQCDVPKQEKFPPSCASNNSLRMTAEETKELLGIPYPGDARNLEDLQVNYTPAQRLSIYTHLLNKIPTAPEQKLNAFYGNTDYDELNAFSTGAFGGPKRRYRVSRPTFNEELRDLVELQMAALRKKNHSGPPTGMKDGWIKHTCSDKGDNSVLRNKFENVHKMACIGQSTSDIERYKNEKKDHHDWAHQKHEHYKHHRHKNSYEGRRSPSHRRQQRQLHRLNNRSRSRSRSRHSTSERRHHRHYTHNQSHSRNHSTKYNRHCQ